MGHFVGAVPRVSSRGRHRLSSELSAYSQGDSGFKFEVKGQILRGCGTARVSSLSAALKVLSHVSAQTASVRLSTEIKEFKKVAFHGGA